MLDKMSINILEFINNCGTVTLEQLNSKFKDISNMQTRIDLLLKLNFIEGVSNPYYGTTSTIIRDIKLCSYTTGPYKITSEGVAYLESIRTQKEKSHIEQIRYNEEKRRSWIQFWIPVGISIISLGIAIASLMLE